VGLGDLMRKYLQLEGVGDGIGRIHMLKKIVKEADNIVTDLHNIDASWVVSGILALARIPHHHTTHEPGGVDVVVGVAPGAHAVTHIAGGADDLEGLLRLAQLFERAHASLTGVGAADHHARYTNAEVLAIAAALIHAARHENGGADEINVAGLLGLLADDQHVLDAEVLLVAAALIHAARHENGGLDEINVGGLSGLLADDQHVLDAEVLAVAAALLHAAQHKDGGADELDVSELAGALGGAGEIPETDGAAVTWVDPDGRYDPKAHAASHEPAGGDPMAVDAIAATGSLRTLGAGAQQAMPGNATPTPGAHAASHQNGGLDEVNVGGLSGLLADDQHVLDAEVLLVAAALIHKDRHDPEDGADALDTAIAGTIQPDDAAAVGTSHSFSRADHKHAIVAAVPGAINENASAEGVATSFARSDHNHQHTAALHENGGGAEISVAGLSGLLADDQHVLDAEVLLVAAPLVHAARHQNGGADEINVGGLSGLLADDQHVLDAEVLLVAAALVHAARHENGGADEISLSGLAGTGTVLTTPQINGIVTTTGLTLPAHASGAIYLGGSVIYQCVGYYGHAGGNTTIHANYVTTDVVERTLSFQALDAVNDVFLAVFAIVPNGAAPYMYFEKAVNFNNQAMANVNIDSGAIDGVTITSPTIAGIIADGGALQMPNHISGQITYTGVIASVKAVDNSLLIWRASTNVAGHGAYMVMYGKTGAAPGLFGVFTPNAAGNADVQRFVISGVLATAVATWSAITHTGIVLSGALAGGGQAIAGLGSCAVGALIIYSVMSATGTKTITANRRRGLLAVQDDTAYAQYAGGSINFQGKYNAAGAYSPFAIIEGVKANVTDGNNEGLLRYFVHVSGGDSNLAMTLSSTGELDCDAAIAGDAFDEFDDAIILRRSEKQLEALEEIGVMKRKYTGSGWMLNFQKMMYLLAGGVYQNREKLDILGRRLETLELALPIGRN